MGLDLTLIPFEHDTTERGFGHSLIDIPRNRDLFAKIIELPTTAIPLSFSTFRSRPGGGAECYGDTQETPYGGKLTAVTMAQLKTLAIPGPPGAFVEASPDHQRVALYWH